MACSCLHVGAHAPAPRARWAMDDPIASVLHQPLHCGRTGFVGGVLAFEALGEGLSWIPGGYVSRQSQASYHDHTRGIKL